MSWIARLNLDYSLESDRSVARFAHDGPLRKQVIALHAQRS